MALEAKETENQPRLKNFNLKLILTCDFDFLCPISFSSLFSHFKISLVSFAAIFRLLMQCWGGALRDEPKNVCEGDSDFHKFTKNQLK